MIKAGTDFRYRIEARAGAACPGPVYALLSMVGGGMRYRERERPG